jgi:hypothetical protein
MDVDTNTVVLLVVLAVAVYIVLAYINDWWPFDCNKRHKQGFNYAAVGADAPGQGTYLITWSEPASSDSGCCTYNLIIEDETNPTPSPVVDVSLPSNTTAYQFTTYNQGDTYTVSITATDSAGRASTPAQLAFTASGFPSLSLYSVDINNNWTAIGYGTDTGQLALVWDAAGGITDINSGDYTVTVTATISGTGYTYYVSPSGQNLTCNPPNNTTPPPSTSLCGVLLQPLSQNPPLTFGDLDSVQATIVYGTSNISGALQMQFTGAPNAPVLGPVQFIPPTP